MDIASLSEELRELVEKQLDSDPFREKLARGVEQAEGGELRDGEEAMADVRRRMLDRRAGSQ